MNKTVSGEENLSFEMEPARKETEARICDDIPDESVAPAEGQASFEKCLQRAEKQRNASKEQQLASQSNAVFLRRMMCLVSVVSVVALLSAIASLFLTLTATKLQGGDAAVSHTACEEPSKECTSLGKNVSSLETFVTEELEKLKAKLQNISQLRGGAGIPGTKGDQGVQGIQGFKGAKGEMGIQGTQGSKGNKGIKGDRGRNGTDGVNGQKGDVGAQGKQGAGDFSHCMYKFIEDPAGVPVGKDSKISLLEPKGMKVLGVVCATNRAEEYNLSVVKEKSGPNAGKYVFTCTCKGKSGLFTDKTNMHCYMHYWMCPVTI